MRGKRVKEIKRLLNSAEVFRNMPEVQYKGGKPPEYEVRKEDSEGNKLTVPTTVKTKKGIPLELKNNCKRKVVKQAKRDWKKYNGQS